MLPPLPKMLAGVLPNIRSHNRASYLLILQVSSVRIYPQRVGYCEEWLLLPELLLLPV
jgi:hypothetical protein